MAASTITGRSIVPAALSVGAISNLKSSFLVAFQRENVTFSGLFGADFRLFFHQLAAVRLPRQ